MFIEGLAMNKCDSAFTANDENVVRDGIFKKIANEALFECIDIPLEKKENLYNFNNFLESFKALFPVGSLLTTFKSSFQIMRYHYDSISIKPADSSSMIQLKYGVLKEMLKSLLLHGCCSEPNFDEKYQHVDCRPLKEILEEYKDTSMYYYSVFSELKKFFGVIKENLINEFYKGNYSLKTTGIKPYVIVIDEINHADIARVFGEVLMLLDSDTRCELSTTMIYSQKRFMLPKNLHILATLNTYDAAAPVLYKNLRHFQFCNLEPDKNQVADFGCGFSDKFEILNKRISILLNKKFRIGHCYFLKNKYANADINDLKNIWMSNIIPLLLVYFNYDWDKLQLLLGEAKSEDSFIKKEQPSGSLYSFAHLRDDNCDFKAIIENAFSENNNI